MSIGHLVAKGWVDEARTGCNSAFLTTTSTQFAAISVAAGISNWAIYSYNTDQDLWGDALPSRWYRRRWPRARDRARRSGQWPGVCRSIIRPQIALPADTSSRPVSGTRYRGMKITT